MKYLALIMLTAIACIALPSQAIEFWHAGTSWVGQGQCSAQFIFDGGGWDEEIRNLQVYVSAVDESGNKVVSGVLTIKKFGSSEADRYANVFWEGEELCENSLIIEVTRATAKIGGRQKDLLKEKLLSVKAFKPFAIRIGQR